MNIFRNKSLQDQVIQTIARDPGACELLVNSGIPRHQPIFVEKLISIVPTIVDAIHNSDNLVGIFLDWCGQAKKSQGLPKTLQRAIAARTSLQCRFRQQKRSFIEQVGLAEDAARRTEFLSQIPTTIIDPLPTPYPPLGHWVYESDSIRDQWEYHIRYGKQPDKRKKRLPLHALRPEDLQHDVPEGESRIFRDSKGNFIALVARNVCASQAAVDSVDATVKEATDHCRSIRLEDTGVLAQAGYSAGLRSAKAPVFDWVNNIRSRKYAAAKGDAMNANTSSSFAFFWNMLRTKVPPEVLVDFSAFLAEIGSLRMDGNGQLDGPADDGLGKYTVKIGDEEFQFCGAELAPPAGVCAENYSRAIHYEFQPHKFGAAWTTSRSRGTDAGGHFFLSKYGIRIRAAPNTLVVWIPRDVHGTSLQDFSPTDKHPEFHQRGLALVTSNRLVGAWKRYQGMLISREEAWAEAFDEDDGGEMFE